MNRAYTEIAFKKEDALEAHFDLISFEDLLKKRPHDHSQFEFHKLSFYVIMLFTSGEGKYNLNFQDYKFKKKALFTIRKDNIHKFYKSDATGVLLVFTDHFILNHSNKLESSNIFMLFNEMLITPKYELAQKEFDEITTLIHQVKSEHQKSNDQFSSIILRSLIQIILTKLFRIKAKDNPLFVNNKKLTTFLRFQTSVERLCFKHRKVSYYAEKMSLSSKKLNSATQAIVQKSAKAFINDILIIRIKREIINASDPLTKIAYNVGFDEPTNFFKFFKKHAGISASDFRDTA